VTRSRVALGALVIFLFPAALVSGVAAQSLDDTSPHVAVTPTSAGGVVRPAERSRVRPLSAFARTRTLWPPPPPPQAERPPARREYIFASYGLAVAIAVAMVILAAIREFRVRKR